MKGLYDGFERKVLIGNSKLQRLFESLHRFSLRGMNYDQVQTVEDSGEMFVIDYIKKKVLGQKEIILFDVGANVGGYSKLLASRFVQSQIYTFEALPATFDLLTKNLATTKQVKCINKALGAKKEERLIYSDGAGSGLSSFYPVEFSANKKLEATTVMVTTIDSFCQENDISQIDFLKIDVEGFELEVLMGATEMIRSGKIRNIQFEFGSNHVISGTHFHTIYQYLSDFNISRVLKNGLRSYESYSKYLEVYLSANYLAELKRNQERVLASAYGI
jgi:FkbM family methyltransferase